MVFGEDCLVELAFPIDSSPLPHGVYVYNEVQGGTESTNEGRWRECWMMTADVDEEGETELSPRAPWGKAGGW